ncbi:hypothetical protein C4553_02520 [Candidatus Parcubacteria bacterium]|nr:MAG: hypothetical protein C4553_02520 [Candidatus Parcubacteria bacterium]
MYKLLSLLALAVLFAPAVASAQVTTIPTGTAPITGIGDFINWLQVLLNWIFILVGILAVVAILIAAIMYLTAGGNEDQRKKAGAWLKWGIVGVVVAIIAGSIIPIVENVLLGQ